MYRLVFLNGRMKGRRVAVQQGTIVIGRDPQCHIDIEHDDEVSRNHAVIEQRPDGVYLKDVGATNKTEVNGQPVTEAKLKHGDTLELGRTRIEYQTIEAASTGAKRVLNRAQILAFAAITVVILVQIGFVFVLPMWQQTELTPAPHEQGTNAPAVATAQPPAQPAAEPAPQPEPPAAPADSLDAALARAHEASVAEASDAGAASATAATEQVSAEVQQLRQALAELQKQVTDLDQQTASMTNEPVPAVAPVTAEEAVQPVAVSAEPTDALQEKAEAMLVQAKTAMADKRYVAADDLIERIQVLAPDFTPAYVERARLYENRGMLKKAGEQWSRVMDLSVGSPLYEEAAAERQRLARTELIQTMTSARDEGKEDAERLQRRIRIANVEREKFEANQEFDEMRLLRINVIPRMREGGIDVDEFICVVVFYDRSQLKETIRPTRAVAPKDALKVEGVWPAGEQKTLAAAYIVPRGFRDEEEKMVGERRAYEGYRILIYYQGVLQDEAARPKSLLALPAPPPPERTGK
ncbi:MAG: FHA domain-containing protein [bacterium]